MNFKLSEATEILRSTPATISSMCSGLTNTWLSSDEGPGTWSARDVVAHLAELEQSDWPVRLRIVMNEGGGGTFAPVDRVRFRETLAKESVPALIATFAARREANLVELAAFGIAEQDLARTATHPAFGTVTLHQFLSAWTVHDLTHIAQIVRVMAKRYTDDAGPWKDYLSILRERS